MASSTIKEAITASTQDHHFIMAANNIVTASTDFLGDTGASHHIAHRLDYFSEIFPLLGVFKIHQVQGIVTVTHWGTVILEVDSSHGKKPFEAEKLFIHRQHALQHSILAKAERSWIHSGLQ